MPCRSTANVAAHIDTLESDAANIASIGLTDSSPSLTLTAAQLVFDASVLLKITGSFGITPAGTASVAQVLGASPSLAGRVAAGFAVSDTASNVAGSLDALESDVSAIASISLTDDLPVLTMTATQLVADAPVLLTITDSYGITLSGTATVAQVLAANPSLTANLTAGFAVSDASSSITGILPRWKPTPP